MQGYYQTREGTEGRTSKGKRVCEECNRTEPKGGMTQIDIYDLPWHDKPRKAYFCKQAPEGLAHDHGIKSCAEMLYNHGNGDFGYFECCECHRTICEQHPGNGWHVQYRTLDGDDYNPGEEKICLRCYEKKILEEGLPRQGFAAGHLEGMFFNRGNPELAEAGYRQELDNVFVSGTAKAHEICKQALDLIDTGNQVVIGYESMGIGGSEGYISMFSKPAWMECPECQTPNHYQGGDKLGNHLIKAHGRTPAETVDMVKDAERVTMEVEKAEVA